MPAAFLGSLFACAMTDVLAEPASKIPFRQAATQGDGGPIQVLLASALCMCILGGVLWLLRRKSASRNLPGRKKRCLHILETQKLGARAFLHVVEFDGQHYLLAQTEQNIRRIASASPVDASEEKSE